jgi:hypothetical protein
LIEKLKIRVKTEIIGSMKKHLSFISLSLLGLLISSESFAAPAALPRSGNISRQDAAAFSAKPALTRSGNISKQEAGAFSAKPALTRSGNISKQEAAAFSAKPALTRSNGGRH